MKSAVWLGAVLVCCSGRLLFAQDAAPVAQGFSSAATTGDGALKPGAGQVAAQGAAQDAQTLADDEPLINLEHGMNGGNLVFQQQDEPELVSPDTASYQFYITDLESRHGAYAAGLSEQLLGLGSVYEEQGLYQQATKIFKRAVHLSRINNGLANAEQIPILQRLISTLVASGEYEEADERQYYLYRIQRQLYDSGAPEMSLAMMERADWERQAYYLAVGETAFGRLLTMWELYRRVLSNIAAAEGSYSMQLLQPLNGLLETQYLIARYNGEAPSGLQIGNGTPETSAAENKFAMVRMSNYKQGQAVITAIREVQLFNESEDSSLAAESLLHLGDWRKYHSKHAAAEEAYEQAWDELAALEKSEQLLAQHFGQPQMLPTRPEAHRDLAPPADIRGYAEVSYSVNQRGRVVNLELLSNEPVAAHPNAEPTRLLRRIKAKKYRPRYEDREPVTTENLVKRYVY